MSCILPKACQSKIVTMVDTFTPADTRRTIDKQVATLPYTARVAASLTGGTKIIFASALEACWERCLEPFCFEIDDHAVIFVRDLVTISFIGAEFVADFFVVTGFDVITNGRWEEEPLPRTTDGCNQRAEGCQADARQALPDVRVSQIPGSLGQGAEPAV